MSSRKLIDKEKVCRFLDKINLKWESLFDSQGQQLFCLVCRHKLPSDHKPGDVYVCSENCAVVYREEFSQDNISFCKFPGCMNPCFVESYRVHDYCGRSHAFEHKKMKEIAESQQNTSRNRKGKGHSWEGGRQLGGKGVTGTSHSQGERYQQGHTLGGANYSPWVSPGPIYFYNRGEPYYEFTNFFAGAAFSLDDSEWPTTEHYFQAQKFVGTPYVHKIRNAFGPRDAFNLSRNPAISRWRRSDWEDVKMDVMRKALFAKFISHNWLMQRLLETDDKLLVERSPHDSYWGDGGDGTGENRLGRLLMELRAKLQGGQYKDVERDGGMKATQSASQSSQTSSSTCVAEGSRYQAMKTSGGLPPSDELTRAPLHGTSSNTQEDVEEMDTKSEIESCYPPFPPHLQLRPLSN